jgi:hypothetical protein
MNVIRLGWTSLVGLSLAGIAAAAPSEGEAAQRACGHGQEHEIEGPRARKPSLALLSVRPAESSYVTDETVVTAELEYDIDKFEPGMYQLNVQFETVDPKITTSGVPVQFPEVQFAHGALRFCFPLGNLWKQPTVKWPLGMKFNLTHRNDDGSTGVIASTLVTRFNVAKLPASALNRASPNADQAAMREAIDKLVPFFEIVQVHVEACAETFPDMKSRLVPLLADWRKRHAGLQKKTDLLNADLMRHRGISGDGLLQWMEAMRTGMLNSLRETPQALSRRNCELMPGRLTGDDYDPAKAQPEAYQLISNFPMH